MNKHDFLTDLGQQLSALPESEKDKSLSYFEELIEDRIEDGMTEEEAVSSLESIEEISKKILLELPLSFLVKARMKPQKKLTSFNIVLICLAFPLWFPLSLAAIAIVFALYVSVWAVIISCYASIAAFGVSGLLSLIMLGLSFQNGIAPGIFALGTSLFSLALSVLLFFPVKSFSKNLIRFSRFGTVKLKSLFIRKEVA